MKNYNFYFIGAMKRSAHHAVINWICEQHGNIKHLNNAIEGWSNREIKCPKHSAGRIKRYGKAEDILVSIEDFDIEDWNKYNFDNFPIIEDANRFYKILVVRDFKNWLSSCLKRREMTGDHRDVYESLEKTYLNDRKETKPSRIQLWKRQFEEIRKNNYLIINFNSWFSSRNYREKLARKLNLNFTDAGLNTIPNFGQGSSFEGMRFNGQANQMKMNERYKLFEEDYEFIYYIHKYRNLALQSERYFKI